MKGFEKYQKTYFMPPVDCYDWVKKDAIDHAPIWCSVDLRDGNQALVEPMSLNEKLEFYQMLLEIGFKHIEVGFPAASDTEYRFLRTLIERNMIPEDVTVQVLTQARDHIIKRTFEAVDGAPNAVVHVYNSTSVAQREQVFRKSKEEIKETEETLENRVIDEKGVGLNQASVSKEDAIREAGALLVKQGCVKDAYVDAMVEREKLVTTYMSMGIAIPHGTSEAKGCVKKTGIVLVQYPQGIDFGGEMAQLIFGIAGIGDEHLDLLSKICGMLEDEEVLEKLKTTSDIDWVFDNLK